MIEPLCFSYEFMRRRLLFYRNEIVKVSGKVSQWRGVIFRHDLIRYLHCLVPAGSFGAVWVIEGISVSAGILKPLMLFLSLSSSTVVC